MSVVGWRDSWRERKVKLNIGQNTRKIFTKEILVVMHFPVSSLMGFEVCWDRQNWKVCHFFEM